MLDSPGGPAPPAPGAAPSRRAAAARLLPPLAPPPSPERRPVVVAAHGREVVDDYAWLRAENWREVLRDPSALPDDLRAHLDAENRHAEEVLREAGDLRRRLVAEMRARVREEDEGVAQPRGPWLYYQRAREGGQHPLHCRRPRAGDDGAAAPDGAAPRSGEQVLIDGDAEAAGLSFYEVEHAEPSPDHRLVAYGLDDQGSEIYRLKVREVESDEAGPGEDLEALEGTTGQSCWLADGTGLLYVALDADHRPNRVLLHRLGDDQADDRLVYEEADPGWFVGVRASRDGRYGVIDAHDHESSEVRLFDLADPDAAPLLVAAREEGVEYDVEVAGERLVIRTDEGGAEDFKLVEAPLNAPGRENWREVLPHRPGVLVLVHAALAGHLLRVEREEGVPRIVVRDLATGEEHAIAFAEDAHDLRLDAGHEHDATEVRFTYSSLTTPAETHAYDLNTRRRRLLKRQVIPLGHDPAAYEASRVFATAPDGERVPVSVLRRRDRPGGGPLLLYGYGAYGYAVPASFAANRFSLVDRGFAYAIAHVRGGTERGRRWYREGKRERKPNTFSDFVAAGRHLCALGLTAPGLVVAHGGSAGGMLMGAVANLDPALFAGIVAEVPFVDVLNTMLDATLPLTPPEWPEWGDPIRSAAAFDAILSYSPYDRVEAKAYPPVLALAGLTDPRVTYWEPAKWIARLRERSTGPAPFLLRTNMGAGHGGHPGRFDRLEEVALAYAFALAAVEGGGRGTA